MPAAVRTGVFALAAAACGVVVLLIMGRVQPALAIEMDRELRRPFAVGISPPEYDGQRFFAWTSERAQLRLRGLDRRAPWTCVIRARGARPEHVAQPKVSVIVDGETVATASMTNDYEDVAAVIAARAEAGATLAVMSAPVFAPGGRDPRQLGIQIDRIVCEPDRAFVWPPNPSLVSSAATTGATGALFGALALSAGAAALGSVVVAAAVGWLLTLGHTPFTPFPAHLMTVAIATTVIAAFVATAASLIRRRTLTSPARLAIAISGVAFVLKTAGLIHPGKTLVDALFQAHRLDAVLGGQYFFTQPMPDGVAFPYAIGLYLFAAPWASLVPDHVLLLRLVSVAMDVIAGGCLYLMAVRTWSPSWTGVVAVMLYHLTRLPFLVLGNANLTNAFAQSVALIAIAAATSWRIEWRRPLALAGVTLITTLALSSHVSTLALLLPTLFLVSGYRWWSVRSDAIALLASTLVALLLSTALYYRHFGDVYAAAWSRVRTTAGDTAGAADAGDAAPARRDGRSRAELVLAETVTAVGWPVLILAAAGLAVVTRERRTAVPLAAALFGWLGVWVAFTAVGLLTRVGPQYERYAIEFVGRINLATYPALALLGARAIGWLWTRERPGGLVWSRALAATGMAAAGVVGARAWMSWVI